MIPPSPIAPRAYDLPTRLDAGTRDAVRQGCLALLAEARGAGEGVLRLRGHAVTHVDAAGLGDLMMIEKRARELGMAVVLERPSGELRYVLGITRLLDFFQIER